MLWTFERNGSKTSYEVWQSLTGSGFELRRQHPDGREESEKFANFEQLYERIAHLERELAEDGWSLAGSGH